MSEAQGYLRIGELGRRVGVRPELLRAWESRYGLLAPSRSPGGFRLYSDEDERRVRTMREHLARGLSAAEAARLSVASDAGAVSVDGGALTRGAGELRESLDAFDDARANRVLDGLLATFSVEAVLRDVLLPYLRELGERWERGEASIAQEHFASNVVRGRLLGLARGWGQGSGPRALLACAPGELHDLGLICFGLALRARGWRVTFLGPDTPLDTLEDATVTLEPTLVVLSASVGARLAAAADDLRAFAGRARVAVGGAGATPERAAEAGALLLEGDPIEAAERVTADATPLPA